MAPVYINGVPMAANPYQQPNYYPQNPSQVPQNSGGSGAGLLSGALLASALAGNGGSAPVAAVNPLASTEAMNAAWNAPGAEAMNAAWNAPADAATVAATPSSWSLSGIGSAGNYLLPVAGTIGAIDLFGNKKHGAGGAAQGALSGAAMGSYFGAPGAILGALIGGGAGYFGTFGDKDRFQEEYKRAQALRDAGVNWNINTEKPSRGRTITELVDSSVAPDFVGLNPMGSWVNNKFAKSRKESDLTGKDIWGYSTFGEKFGNDWFNKFSEQQRENIANKVLENKAFREHQGQGDINWTPELDAAVQSIINPPKVETKKK